MVYRVNEFGGGQVDFFSARDLRSDQFPRLENMRIARVSRLEKRLGETARTVESATALQVLPGMGHIQYRTERDESGVHVSSHFRTVSLMDVSGTPAVSIRWNNSINDDIGTFTEFLGSSVWTTRTVVGDSDISFVGSIISAPSGLDTFFPGDVIRIFSSGENDKYIHVVSASATQVVVQETFITDSNTSAILIAFPHVSMYAVAGVLRISDGNFQNDSPSQWYGHIKRDFWGQTISYGANGGRYFQPPPVEAYDDWLLVDQELVAPTVIRGNLTGAATSAVNEVAIHIATAHPADWPDRAIEAKWSKSDRVACTFTYDFVQESELSRTADGGIGIPIGADGVNDVDTARAFMVEAYTGVDNVSFNKRITAINLYYQFNGDPDWYLVESLNIEKGWKESVKVFEDGNTGYWQPIVESLTKSGTTDAGGGSDVTINSGGHGVLAGEQIYLFSTTLIQPASLVSVPDSVTTNTMTLPVAAIDSLGTNPADYNDLPWTAGIISAISISTFFIPFTGEKAFSYFTQTGRAAALKVPAVRWRAAVTDGAQSLIGNIDTLDENSQTLRERSRVIEMPVGMNDTALLIRSKDVGISEGDEIIALAEFQDKWWVLKERNTHVLQKGTLRTLSQFKGVGCSWQHSFVITPFGLAVADNTRIKLLPSGEEITLPVRKTYQSLTFFNPILTYSHRHQLLHFIPDTSSETSDMLTFDMSPQSRGWMEDNFPARTSLSNFVEGRHYEPEVMFEDGDSTLNILGNTDDWEGATGITPPYGFGKFAGSTTWNVVDLSGVANFDSKVLEITDPNDIGGSIFARDDPANGVDNAYFVDHPEKVGLVFRYSYAYRAAIDLGLTFTGSGLDDMTNFGIFRAPSDTWRVEIDSTGATDTFKWYRGGVLKDSGVAITGAPQEIDTTTNANTINFGAITGHTLGDYWEYTGAQVIIDKADGEGAIALDASAGLTGDAILVSEDYIATAGNTQFGVQGIATLQLDNVIISQLNSFHVKQLNSGATDEIGLIRTQDIVMGNRSASIRNFYLSYKSTDVPVTVKVYLNNAVDPHHEFDIPASSTLVSKHLLELKVEAKVLSLSFESTATDFTVEDMEIPDSEITFNDR